MNLETKKSNLNPGLGVLLVALGALALLSQIGLFRGLGSVLGAVLFGFAGLYLIRNQYRERGEVWALCTGFGLLGLGAAAISGPLAGTAFLGLTGAGFLVAYRDDSNRWWAVIPGGILVTLAVVAGLERFASPMGGGPIFFLGLAAIFWYIYRHPSQNRRWAVYPAVALTVLALLSLSFSGGWVLPLALIAAGVYFLNREQGGRLDWRETAESVNAQVEKLLKTGEQAVRGAVSRAEGQPGSSSDSASADEGAGYAEDPFAGNTASEGPAAESGASAGPVASSTAAESTAAGPEQEAAQKS